VTDYRRIVALLVEGRSYREVVEMVGCSHRDVSRVKRVIEERGVTSASVVSDEDLAEWFPDGRRRVSAEYEQPDLGAVLAAMRAQRPAASTRKRSSGNGVTGGNHLGPDVYVRDASHYELGTTSGAQPQAGREAGR